LHIWDKYFYVEAWSLVDDRLLDPKSIARPGKLTL
jgi:hypothetical protein